MNKKITWTELSGWIGLACLQFNSIPAIISSVETGNTTPIPSIILTIIGLILYLIRSIKTNDILYTTGNIIGITGNIILLGTILI